MTSRGLDADFANPQHRFLTSGASHHDHRDRLVFLSSTQPLDEADTVAFFLKRDITQHRRITLSEDQFLGAHRFRRPTDLEIRVRQHLLDGLKLSAISFDNK